MPPILLALTVAAGAPGFTPPGENLALGRPYTLQPRPQYQHCTDPGDDQQLTDGQYVEGYFWVQQGCVGWSGVGQALITLDLGEVRPIGGLSFSTAAGVAGVTWPSAICVLVSDDGQTWFSAGELCTLSAKLETPPAEGYATHRYRTGELAARGRYVAVGILASGPYTFCDEIEIYRGPDALLAAPRAEPGLADPLDWLKQQRYDAEVRQQVSATIEAVRAQIAAAPLDEAARAELTARLPRALPASFARLDRAILPLSREQLRAFGALGELWRRLGRPVLTAWEADRWAPLEAVQIPPAEPRPPALEVALMRGEQRAAALNLASADRGPLRLNAEVRGVPGVTVKRVEWTAVAGYEPAASALVPLDDRLFIPGLVQQLWIQVDSRGVEPGVYRGDVVIRASELIEIRGGPPLEVTVPLTVRVSPVTMPEELTLSLGGWDYTDAPGRSITAENLDATVAFLREYKINAPWATSRVMPFGQHGPDGAMVAEPDTRAMDAWLDRWPGARWYCVFNAFGEPVPDTAAGRRRVADWISFWARHLQQRGVEPRQLCLLLADEPHDQALSDVIVSYARIIQDVEPEVVVWNDPTFSDPHAAPPELFETADVLCPNRVMWLGNAAAFDEVYLAQARAGRQVVLYSCSGPVRALDPYSYHRLQAWDCWRIGGVQSFFWAFCDAGAGNAWQELGSGSRVFSPQFLDAAGNTPSKHLEAIRESAYDYEYLALLRAALAAGRGSEAQRRAAAELLESGPRRVLGAPGVSSIQWRDDKDRTIADQVRLEVLALLEAMGE